MRRTNLQTAVAGHKASNMQQWLSFVWRKEQGSACSFEGNETKSLKIDPKSLRNKRVSVELSLKTPRFFSFVQLQRNIRSIKQFVSLREEERRSLLRSLTDDEYRDVMNVCASMPNVSMEVTSKGTYSRAMLCCNFTNTKCSLVSVWCSIYL